MAFFTADHFLEPRRAIPEAGLDSQTVQMGNGAKVNEDYPQPLKEACVKGDREGGTLRSDGP